MGCGPSCWRLLCALGKTPICSERAARRIAHAAPGQRKPSHSWKRTRTKPFLAYLAFYAVHSPIQTTKPLWKKYRDKHLPSCHRPLNVSKLTGRCLSARVQDNPIYAGLIDEMDNATGRVLRRLDELGLATNTIVVFTSDNGGVSSGGQLQFFLELPLSWRQKARQWGVAGFACHFISGRQESQNPAAFAIHR